MKYITYKHTSHSRYVSNGSVFQEILSCYIISIFCNLEVVYHETWKYCGFITHKSFKRNTTKSLDNYEAIININNYCKWESLNFQDLIDIKNKINKMKDNTLIILGNVCLINPSYLYKWYKSGLLDIDYYSNIFLPKLNELYFYDHLNKEIEEFYIHIRNGDIGKKFYDFGLNLKYYTDIIKKINSVSDMKINIIYEGGDPKKTTLELTPCYKNERKGYNHLWVTELGKLPNVILKEGNLDNLDIQINELCRAKYLLLSPSTLSYYCGMISKGIKFIDKIMISLHKNGLSNTTDLPNFNVFGVSDEILTYLKKDLLNNNKMNLYFENIINL